MDDQDICICVRIQHASHQRHLPFARARELYTLYRHPLHPKTCAAIEQPKETWERRYDGDPVSSLNVAAKVSPEPSRLLGLPTEVRLHIWHQVFANARLEFSPSTASSRYLGLWQARPPKAAVLLTCKAVNEEAAPILERQLVAHFPPELVEGPARSHRRRPRQLFQFTRSASHVLKDDHLDRINRTIRSIQLPKITITTLARIDLSEYTALREVQLSLLSSPDLCFPQRSILT